MVAHKKLSPLSYSLTPSPMPRGYGNPVLSCCPIYACQLMIVQYSYAISSEPTLLHMQALRDALHSCMTQQGQGLVQALAVALVQTCPRHLVRALAAPLQALVKDPTLSNGVWTLFSQIVCSQLYIGNHALVLHQAFRSSHLRFFCHKSQELPNFSRLILSSTTENLHIAKCRFTCQNQATCA